MDLHELLSHIETALDKCQDIINENRYVVLSEGDLERLVCRCITDEIKEEMGTLHDFSVHSQVSHYYEEDGKPSVDARVDVLLLKESELQGQIYHKEFKYDGDSFAMELKYLHKNDSISKVKCDFCKWSSIRNDSWMYVVVLIDGYSDIDIQKKEDKIKLMYEQELLKYESDQNENQLKYKVLH